MLIFMHKISPDEAVCLHSAVLLGTWPLNRAGEDGLKKGTEQAFVRDQPGSGGNSRSSRDSEDGENCFFL